MLSSKVPAIANERKTTKMRMEQDIRKKKIKKKSKNKF
jgi:hypothetical protein